MLQLYQYILSYPLGIKDVDDPCPFIPKDKIENTNECVFCLKLEVYLP